MKMQSNIWVKVTPDQVGTQATALIGVRLLPSFDSPIATNEKDRRK
jgi:hypothetical protein